eukprot:jgi/Bigna1/139283/aug1.49_g13991
MGFDIVVTSEMGSGNVLREISLDMHREEDIEGKVGFISGNVHGGSGANKSSCNISTPMKHWYGSDSFAAYEVASSMLFSTAFLTFGYKASKCGEDLTKICLLTAALLLAEAFAMLGFSFYNGPTMCWVFTILCVLSFCAELSCTVYVFAEKEAGSECDPLMLKALQIFLIALWSINVTMGIVFQVYNCCVDSPTKKTIVITQSDKGDIKSLLDSERDAEICDEY